MIVGYGATLNRRSIRISVTGRYPRPMRDIHPARKRRPHKGRGIWWLIERGFRVNRVR